MTNIWADLKASKDKGHKKFAVLIDPDQYKVGKLDQIIALSKEVAIDYFFVGGSLIVNDMLDKVLDAMKKESNIPMILFPGNSYQLSYKADGILFLSLISGRNADLLIGNHVIAAPFLKIAPLEILPTGYMLIDGGISTTVLYMSNTTPIPAQKTDIAVCTAVAGEMLGLKLIYMDAGSGALNPIPVDMIRGVASSIDIPLIIGGGIKSADKAHENYEAGADVIVVGNAIETNPQLIRNIAAIRDSFNNKKE